MKKNWIAKMEPLAGSTTSNIIRLTIDNKCQISPKYWFRYYIAMRGSNYFLPLRCIERVFFNRKIKQTKILSDPLFIIGHWRTGTTYLHNIISLDKSKGYVSNLEAYCPHFFLSFRKFSRRLVDYALPPKRPMDNVKMGSKETAEEEYALGNYDRYGFYNALIFPKNFNYYSKYLTFEDCSKKDIEKWKNKYFYFIQKMTYKHKGKMMILKNPANTSRIKFLLELFPNAKFVHIYRNPYFILASTIRFYREVLPLYALQKWDDTVIMDGFISNFKKVYDVFEIDKKLIKNNLIEIKYEDFVKNPLKDINRIYSELQIDGFDSSEKLFKDYIANQKIEYKPNVHNLTTEIIEKVNFNWSNYLERYDYEYLENKK